MSYLIQNVSMEIFQNRYKEKVGDEKVFKKHILIKKISDFKFENDYLQIANQLQVSFATEQYIVYSDIDKCGNNLKPTLKNKQNILFSKFLNGDFSFTKTEPLIQRGDMVYFKSWYTNPKYDTKEENVNYFVGYIEDIKIDKPISIIVENVNFANKQLFIRYTEKLFEDVYTLIQEIINTNKSYFNNYKYEIKLYTTQQELTSVKDIAFSQQVNSQVSYIGQPTLSTFMQQLKDSSNLNFYFHWHEGIWYMFIGILIYDQLRKFYTEKNINYKHKIDRSIHLSPSGYNLTYNRAKDILLGVAVKFVIQYTIKNNDDYLKIASTTNANINNVNEIGILVYLYNDQFKTQNLSINSVTPAVAPQLTEIRDLIINITIDNVKSQTELLNYLTDQAKKEASPYLARINYDGFRGSFAMRQLPLLRVGYEIEYKDKFINSLDGFYILNKIEFNNFEQIVYPDLFVKKT